MVTVYVDVLLLVNGFVDYLLLSLTAAVYRERPKLGRLILSSFVAASFSLVIFLPLSSFWWEAAIRAVCSTVTVMVCFGFGSFRRFLRLTAAFYASTFLFAGCMLAVVMLANPQNLAVTNGVVYWNVSPLWMIGGSLGCYLLVALLRRLSRRNGGGGETLCLHLTLASHEITLRALVDTGHAVTDPLTGAGVIITDEPHMKMLLGEARFSAFLHDPTEDPLLCGRYRVIPCQTVAGKELLSGLRCDKVTVSGGRETYTVTEPVLAMSEEKLGGDYHALVGTEFEQVTV